VRIALGADLSADPLTWAWQDITDKVRFDLGINIETGRRENSGSVTTARGALKLDNRDGRFSRRNPTGPYYGLLSKNTPIWVTVDAGTGEKTRVELYVNEWPVRWADKSATDSTVTVACAGVLRRLAQGRVLKSALRRATSAAGPVGYWPMEDGADTTVVASAVVGVAAMTFIGTVDFASADGPAGSGLLCSGLIDDGGTLLVPDVVPAGTTTWQQSFVFNPHTGTSGLIVEWQNPLGTSKVHRISYSVEGDTLQVLRYDDVNDVTGTTTAGTDPGVVIPNEYNHVVWQQSQSGANIAWSLYINGELATSGTFADTSGPPRSVAIAPDRPQILPGTGPVSLGHYALFSGADDLTGLYSAMNGYAGEQAHVRMARLCDEENVVFETLASQSSVMGPQGIDTLVSLLHDCESVGGGVLYEKRFGLAYQSLGERYNAPTAIALDFASGHIAELPEPADDDERTRNLWTVSRIDGSEYVAEQTTGPMGTGAQGPGTYDDSLEVNVEVDDQLDDQAGWRVHLGTVDEDRWPRLDLNFTRNPTLIDSWTALPYGSRVTVANPLSQMPPDPLDLVIEGHAERFDSKLWTATLNASPASAYRAFVVEASTGNLGRLAATTSVLAADATSSETTIRVRSSSAWTTGAVNFSIGVAGEQMTVTNIGPTPTVDTFSRVTAAGGWGTADSGDAWSVVSGAASQFSTDGSSGLMTHSAPGFCQISLPYTATDDDITVTCTTSSIANYADFAIQLRFTDTSNYYRAVYRFDTNALEIDVRRDGTTGTLSGPVTPTSTGGASVGPVKLRFQIIGNTLSAKAWRSTFTEPAAWDTTASDATLPTGSGIALSTFDATAAKTFTFDNVVSQTATQLWTVTRAVNGVTKVQPATVGGFATQVSLWQPAVIAL
jgi:hypothetical protein